MIRSMALIGVVFKEPSIAPWAILLRVTSREAKQRGGASSSSSLCIILSTAARCPGVGRFELLLALFRRNAAPELKTPLNSQF